MVISSGFLLISSIIIGIIAIFFGFYSLKFNIVEGSRWFKIRAIAILFLAVGFSLHTLGDYLSQFYGAVTELAIESTAHVILFIGFVFFVYASKEILNISKQYGFK